MPISIARGLHMGLMSLSAVDGDVSVKNKMWRARGACTTPHHPQPMSGSWRTASGRSWSNRSVAEYKHAWLCCIADAVLLAPAASYGAVKRERRLEQERTLTVTAEPLPRWPGTRVGGWRCGAAGAVADGCPATPTDGEGAAESGRTATLFADVVGPWWGRYFGSAYTAFLPLQKITFCMAARVHP
eukprot:TRINITY_DN18118_c0_g1_i1.p3 TRINITY_DN18118_c0_g1~~TRINITY_DN18118_c0_g1_i1.p3  ORF type:complete len:186 (-),score=4.27 TRINITY_DN18118_c0_g1_i1:137-694(-)